MSDPPGKPEVHLRINAFMPQRDLDLKDVCTIYVGTTLLLCVCGGRRRVGESISDFFTRLWKRNKVSVMFVLAIFISRG